MTNNTAYEQFQSVLDNVNKGRASEDELDAAATGFVDKQFVAAGMTENESKTLSDKLKTVLESYPDQEEMVLVARAFNALLNNEKNTPQVFDTCLNWLGSQHYNENGSYTPAEKSVILNAARNLGLLCEVHGGHYAIQQEEGDQRSIETLCNLFSDTIQSGFQALAEDAATPEVEAAYQPELPDDGFSPLNDTGSVSVSNDVVKSLLPIEITHNVIIPFYSDYDSILSDNFVIIAPDDTISAGVDPVVGDFAILSEQNEEVAEHDFGIAVIAGFERILLSEALLRHAQHSIYREEDTAYEDLCFSIVSNSGIKDTIVGADATTLYVEVIQLIPVT